MLNKELDDAVVIGPKTNLAFLRALMRSPEVASGSFDTGFIDAHLARSRRLAASARPARGARRGAAPAREARRVRARRRFAPTIPGASPTRSNSSARAGSGST